MSEQEAPCWGCGSKMTGSKRSFFWCWVCGMYTADKEPTMKEFYEWFKVELEIQNGPFATSIIGK